MTSDLQPAATEDQTPKRAPDRILESEIREGVDTLEFPVRRLFISALSAGLDLGFSLFLMAAMLTRCENSLPKPIVDMLVANMYSVGFIFVILGRSELFTEQTTLAVLPVLGGREPFSSLLRLWAVVWAANLIGATLFAGLVSIVGPALGLIEPAALGEIAHNVVAHTGPTMFLSALLAGWLMGLLSWLVAAGRDTISQIVLVWLVTTAIGFAGLHHVVLGMVEVMAGVFAHQGIGTADVAAFLFWTTLGNIFGGTVFVAVIKYGHAKLESSSIRPAPLMNIDLEKGWKS